MDDLEDARCDEMELQGKEYNRIVKEEYRWNVWACPKTDKGEIDHKNAMTGDDLADFVNLKLFPYLKNFKATAATPDTLEYKIGEIFSELKNKIVSGYNMREILNEPKSIWNDEVVMMNDGYLVYKSEFSK